jgi:hypothetical protein
LTREAGDGSCKKAVRDRCARRRGGADRAGCGADAGGAGFEIEGAEGEKTPYTVTVKAISVKGTPCAKAYEFFRLSYNGEKTGKYGYPQNYRCENAEFKVPAGYIPTICSKPGKTIKYGAQGG